MTRCTWFPALIGLTLLAGCARPPADPVVAEAFQPSALADRGSLAGEKSLDLVIQAPGDGSPAGWTQADIDLFRIVLTDAAGNPIQSVDLPQKNLPAGESPRSRLRFEGLRHGATYHASVLAMRGEQVINAQNPTSVTFAFTDDQDVEDTLSRTAPIQLDDRSFAGTLRLPLSKLKSKFKNSHQEDSSSMTVLLEVQTSATKGGGFEKVFEGAYARPRSTWYRDYLLINLSFGTTYRVTLTSTYNDDGKTKKDEIVATFEPFSDPSTDSYAVPTNKFK